MVYIVTPFHNSFDSFSETYLSVINQSYSNWEWVIIDDFSDEKEYRKLIKLVEPNKNILVIRNTVNLGSGGSRNIGLNLCPVKTKYIAFIDSDDTWSNNFLSESISMIRTFDVDITYGGYVRKNGIKRDVFIPNRVNNSANIFRGCDISCLATLIKVKSHPFEYRFGNTRTRNDLFFFANILKDYKAFPNPLILSEYNIHSKSLSYQKWKLIISQIHVQNLVNKKYEFSITYNWFFWIIRGINKYKRIRI